MVIWPFSDTVAFTLELYFSYLAGKLPSVLSVLGSDSWYAAPTEYA